MSCDTLARSIEEIQRLRNDNAILGAKCEVLEIFATALGLRKERVYQEDILGLLKKEYEEKKNEIIGKNTL